MHPRRSWLALGLLAVFAAQAAVVYKWTDADGVVHYSDQPVPGAEKIATGATSGSNVASMPSHSYASPKSGAQNPRGGFEYATLSIVSPTPDQSFFGDDTITVGLLMEPALLPNHVISWHLNGAQLSDQEPNATHFTLQGLERGTYVISATVTDQGTGQAQNSDSVTFFVRQPSELSPQSPLNKHPPPVR